MATALASPAIQHAAPKWPSFDWTDPFLLDALLTDEEPMVRDTARAFCEAELAPIVKLSNRNEIYDRSLMAKFGAAGLSAPKIEGKFPLRAWVTGEIVMEDVHIPRPAACGGRGVEGPQQATAPVPAGCAPCDLIVRSTVDPISPRLKRSDCPVKFAGEERRAARTGCSRNRRDARWASQGNRRAAGIFRRGASSLARGFVARRSRRG